MFTVLNEFDVRDRGNDFREKRPRTRVFSLFEGYEEQIREQKSHNLRHKYHTRRQENQRTKTTRRKESCVIPMPEVSHKALSRKSFNLIVPLLVEYIIKWQWRGEIPQP